MLSRATVVIPLHKRVVLVRFLNGPEFSSRLSKISQAHNTISGIQFRVGSGGLDERRSLGSVPVSSCSSTFQGRLRSFAQFRVQLIDTTHVPLPRRLYRACSCARQLEHRLGTNGSADPNCTLLTTNSADWTDSRGGNAAQSIRLAAGQLGSGELSDFINNLRRPYEEDSDILKFKAYHLD